jgi:hypothetical protein
MKFPWITTLSLVMTVEVDHRAIARDGEGGKGLVMTFLPVMARRL